MNTTAWINQTNIVIFTSIMDIKPTVKVELEITYQLWDLVVLYIWQYFNQAMPIEVIALIWPHEQPVTSSQQHDQQTDPRISTELYIETCAKLSLNCTQLLM